MEVIKELFENRKKYFDNLNFYLKEIKKLVKSLVPDAKVYLFGSVIKGNYSIGLSDIDIAIVSKDFENRDKKLKVLDVLLKKFFESPFEFHVLSENQWKYYLNFIKKDFKEF